MRTSPFPTALLHTLHVALLVGASPIEYMLARVLNPGVFFILAAHTSQRPVTELTA